MSVSICESSLRALEIDRIKAVRRGVGVWSVEIVASGVLYRREGPTMLSALGQAVDAAHNDQTRAGKSAPTEPT